MLNGLFDIDNRLDYLTENGDMLPRLKELVPWEKFRVRICGEEGANCRCDHCSRSHAA